MALDRFKLLYELQDSDSDWSVKRNYLSSNPYLTTEQIDLLYPDESVDKIGLAQFPKLTDEQFMRLFNDGAKNYLARNPNLTPKQIDLLYDAGGDKDYLAQYPKLTDEQFLRLFQDDDVKIIKYLAQNPNLTPKQIDLLYDAGSDKESLAQYPKLTDEQFLRAFNDGLKYKLLLTKNPSINAPANKPFASGVFNWSW